MVRKGVIDFSAFLNKNREVIIKELSVIDIDSKCVQHWMFQPPQDDCHLGPPWNDKSPEYRNAWMSTHLHGLYYTGGFTLYESLPSILMHICRGIEILYTPTVEKANVLQNIFNHERAVIGLESLGCPMAKQTRLFDMERGNDGPPSSSSSCLFHEIYAPGFYCTQSAVQTLARWCADHPDKVDMNKVENRIKTFDNWQLTAPTSQQLAEQGFVHLAGSKDSTKCLYCGIILHQWKAEDNPTEEHEFTSPFCLLARYKAQQRQEEEEAEKNSKEGQDVCGCREMAKITENELYNLCYT